MSNIVITGTSQGIGLEFTRQSLAAGHRVLAIVRHSNHMHELKTLTANPKLQICETDLTQSEAIPLIQEALKQWEKVDILINNAGVYLEDKSVENFLQSFHVNSIIPYFLTKSLFPFLKKSASPRAIFISSQMGSIQDNSSGGSHAYRASKAALNMIVKGLSQEESWLTSTTFHPGWVQTNMGGENAPVQPEDSVRGLLKIIHELGPKDSGRFLTFQGKSLPW